MSGEKIARPFILIITLMSMFILVLGLLQHVFAVSQVFYNEPTSASDMFGLWNWTFIDPTDGFVVTNASVTNEMVYPTTAPFIFTDDSGDKKYVQVIRANNNYDPTSSDIWKKYSDFISVQRNPYPGHASGKWYGAAIPYTAFVASFDAKGNNSIIGFYISSKNDTLFMHLTDNNTQRIWNNDYTLFYGWSLFRQNQADFWGTIKMIMLAEIPGANPIVQMFISGLWLGTIIFVSFTLISRIVPFIGGG